MNIEFWYYWKIFNLIYIKLTSKQKLKKKKSDRFSEIIWNNVYCDNETLYANSHFKHNYKNKIQFKIYFSHNIVINETNSCFDSTFSIILIKKKKTLKKYIF